MPTHETDVGQSPKAPQAMAIAGIIFAILLTVSLILIRLAMPATLNEAIQGASRVTVSRSLITGINLLPFAGLAFLWFIGVIRDYIGEREDRFFATILLGSGLLFIAMVFVTAGVAGGLISTLMSETSHEPNVTLFFFGRAVSSNIAYVYAARMAGVFMFSTTILTRRVDLLPRWLAYIGFVFAIVLLISISRVEWIILLFPLWVLVYSVFILFKRRA